MGGQAAMVHYLGAARAELRRGRADDLRTGPGLAGRRRRIWCWSKPDPYWRCFDQSATTAGAMQRLHGLQPTTQHRSVRLMQQ